jgi:hypothetical protein
MVDELEPVIGSKELCAHYKIDPRTLSQRAREAGVHGRKPGREILYTRSEVTKIEAVMIARAGGNEELSRLAPGRDDAAAGAVRTARRHSSNKLGRSLREHLLPDPKRGVVAVDFARRRVVPDK